MVQIKMSAKCYATKILLNEKDSRPIKSFVRKIRDAFNYRPEMIVIDDNPSLLKAVKEVYPFIPIQLCALHKEWRIEGLLPDSKINDDQKELKKKIHEFLYAETPDEALQFFHYVINNKSFWRDENSQNAIRSIERDMKCLLTHCYVDKRLKLQGNERAPRTVSVIESLFSRFDMKRDQIRGFKSERNLDGYINLMIMQYRATRMEGAKDKRSPLERAGRKVDDWVWFSQHRKGCDAKGIESTDETPSSNS